MLRSCDDGLICNQVYTRDRRGAPIPDRFVVKEAGVSVLLTKGHESQVQSIDVPVDHCSWKQLQVHRVLNDQAGNDAFFL